jgi:hypothetical protein
VVVLLAENELLAAVHALVNPLVEAARRAYGPLPSLKTSEFLQADENVRVATLLVVAEAYLLADPHQVIRAALRSAAEDVHGGDTRRWRVAAAATPRSTVLAARARAVTPARCTQPGCRVLVELSHPLPDLGHVKCAEHERRRPRAQ